MHIYRSAGLTGVVVALAVTATHAGPCSPEIARMQARVDALIGAAAAAGPSAREGVAATMHRQPTPGSIAAAEARLGEGAPERALAAMARARAADNADDRDTCERALADAESAIGR